MATTNLLTSIRDLYRPPWDHPVMVDVPLMQFATADGHGAPGGTEYQEALQALFSVSYTLKFALKKEDPALDFKVGPLETLWRIDGLPHLEPSTLGREAWHWTAMIAQPPTITPDRFSRACSEAGAKRPLVVLWKVRLEPFQEGLSAQIMHVGPYAEEGPTIERLHAFIEGQGYVPRGAHHELYLGDPRRSAPERLRTVIRQPIAPR